MNKDILNVLTFGFEIEGYFKEGLRDKLTEGGQFKHDGSVNEVELFFDSNDEEDSELDSDGDWASEYSSPIFESFDKVIEDLSKFNENTHHWNITCGLHFHIGIKGGNWKQLWSATSNFTFLKKLHSEALKYCDCQKQRLNDDNREDRYYGFWKNSKDLIYRTKRGSKYSFIRFHNGYGTLECRFLSPCEHKVENVAKLLNSLTDFLGSSEESATNSVVDDTPQILESLKLSLELYKPSSIVSIPPEIIEFAGQQGYTKRDLLRDRTLRANFVNGYQRLVQDYSNTIYTRPRSVRFTGVDSAPF